MIRIAVIGAENVGKSTFVNLLTGRTVSEVSETPGTTKGTVKSRLGKFSIPKHVRNPLGGVEDFVVVDTAGLFDPEFEMRGKVLSEERFRRILEEIGSCDVIVHMIDVRYGLHRGMEKLHHLLKFRYGRPVVVIINKVDLVDRERALEVAEMVRKRLGDRPVLTSLLTGEGVRDAVAEILRVAGYVRAGQDV
ncbi:MAG: GTP-binding protein [Thermococci archaeon]|nr:GTP-binding protein [Thermococci archaeon]